MTRKLILAATLTATASLGMTTLVGAHGDVAPQAMNTDTLPDVGEEWLIENPYRAEVAGEDVWAEAVRIGASGYNSNCARCHGLEVVSGGLAPDLRFLEAEEYGDEWYMERFIHGYTQNGITKMPAFGELLGQKAGWAIRTYIETRPDDASMEEFSEELKGLRDTLASAADNGSLADEAGVTARLEEIAMNIETVSGAPVADSPASRAVAALDGTATGYKNAAEALTIGLSAAQ